MSTHSEEPARELPANPDLRHLKDQAKDLLKAGQAESLDRAQFQIARLYGFASWPKLKAHVESLQLVGQLKLAIDANDLAEVKRLMMRHPELHRAPLGYGKERAAHVGRRMPRASRAPQRDAARHGGMDDRERIRRDLLQSRRAREMPIPRRPCPAARSCTWRSSSTTSTWRAGSSSGERM